MRKKKFVARTPTVSFLELLGLVFITLKLAGFITWSWWLITLPLFLSTYTFLCILLGKLCVIVYLSLIMKGTRKT